MTKINFNKFFIILLLQLVFSIKGNGKEIVLIVTDNLSNTVDSVAVIYEDKRGITGGEGEFTISFSTLPITIYLRHHSHSDYSFQIQDSLNLDTVTICLNCTEFISSEILFRQKKIKNEKLSKSVRGCTTPQDDTISVMFEIKDQSFFVLKDLSLYFSLEDSGEYKVIISIDSLCNPSSVAFSARTALDTVYQLKNGWNTFPLKARFVNSGRNSYWVMVFIVKAGKDKPDICIVGNLFGNFYAGNGSQLKKLYGCSIAYKANAVLYD